MAKPDKATPADLFGIAQKRAQARRAMAARNKADGEADLRPVQKPLPRVWDEEDGAKG